MNGWDGDQALDDKEEKKNYSGVIHFLWPAQQWEQ